MTSVDWYLFRQRIAAEHSLQPQVLAKLDRAISLVEEGLRDLVGAGHQFHLAPGPQPPQPAFPRKVFHVDRPRGKLVYTQTEIDLLGPEWFDSIAEAHHSHGLRIQYTGRGGVDMGAALPALVMDSPSVSKVIQWNEDEITT